MREAILSNATRFANTTELPGLDISEPNALVLT